MRYPVGKLYVEIDSVTNFDWEGKSQNVFVRLTCPPYTVYTANAVAREEEVEPGKLKQCLYFGNQFLIPIHNNFNTLTVEVVSTLSKGWIRKYKQDFVLAKFQIRLPDIKINPETGRPGFNGQMELPLDTSLDFKKLGLKHTGQTPLDQSCLRLTVKEKTHPYSMLRQNPNRDIIEDRRQKETFGIRDVSPVLSRTKMVLYYFDWFKQIDTFIHHFDYPKFSRCCYLLLMLVIFLFESRYLLTYLLLILLLVVISYSDFFAVRLQPKLREYFFDESLMHPLLKEQNNVIKFEEVGFTKLQSRLITNEQV